MIFETARDLRDQLSALYSAERAPKWLALAAGLQSMLRPGEEYFGGSAPCLADYVVFQALTLVEAARPAALEAAGLSGLLEFRARFERRPRIEAYLASARRMPLTQNELQDPAAPWSPGGYTYLAPLRWAEMLEAAAEAQSKPLAEPLERLLSLSGGWKEHLEGLEVGPGATAAAAQ